VLDTKGELGGDAFVDNDLLRAVGAGAGLLGGVAGHLVPARHGVQGVPLLVNRWLHHLVRAGAGRLGQVLVTRADLAAAGHGVVGGRVDGDGLATQDAGQCVAVWSWRLVVLVALGPCAERVGGGLPVGVLAGLLGRVAAGARGAEDLGVLGPAVDGVVGLARVALAGDARVGQVAGARAAVVRQLGVPDAEAVGGEDALAGVAALGARPAGQQVLAGARAVVHGRDGQLGLGRLEPGTHLV